MCGIAAYIGNEKSYKYIIDNLKLLQNRGYDSAGICLLHNEKLFVKKYTSTDNINAIDLLEMTDFPSDNLSNIGIGHTRWATHGARSNVNAHPHIDYSENIALVHNGIIENYLEIKEFLISKKILCKSETDSEVIVNLLGYYVNQGYTFVEAINCTLNKIEGTYALVILYKKHPNKLYLICNGSPLVVGISDDNMVVMSEPCNMSKYICLKNVDFQTIERKGGEIKITNIEKYKIIKNSNQKIVKLEDTIFSHWTIKEIMDQPMSSISAIRNRIDNGQVKLHGLDTYKDTLMGIKNLIILGCGTSYFAGLLGMKYFRSMNCFHSTQIIDGAEFTVYDIPENGPTALLFLSQSGETKDLHRCMKIAKENNLFTISVVNSVGSLIARDSICGVYLNAGKENGVASTKSFTSQSIVLVLIACWFAQKHNIYNGRRILYLDSLVKLSVDIRNVLLTNRKKCRYITSKINKCQHLFILGKGMSEPISKEGSLKIKEISYIHAEGYSGSALKHGPFALIEHGTPIILVAPDDEHFGKMKITAEEIKCRGAYIILITDKTNLENVVYDQVIHVPHNVKLTHLLSVIPLQLLAYELAIYKGFNPDFPRNLAKVVTVD